MKMENTLLYAYYMNKSNAKTRKTQAFPEGIPWNLEFEDWCEFWAKYPDQWAEKKRSLQNNKSRGVKNRTCVWEVDRIDPDDPRGYHPDNIRIVSKLMNVWYQWNPDMREMDFQLQRFINQNPDFDWAKDVPF